jgi:N-methylhydantoinase A
MRIATDVGGTFTDLVYFDVDKKTGEIAAVRTAKVDSTPPNFEGGVMAVLDKAAVQLADCEFFVHGSTAVINAITERKGVKTALITTRGFRDVLEIGRGNRPALFDFRYQKPTPFVPRHLRQVMTERIDHKGEVATALALDEVGPIVDYFRAEGVEAIAICFLHAYANPAHEIAVAARIKDLWPQVTVVSSHTITREWREYERTNTAVVSAYITPMARNYLSGLDKRLSAGGFKRSVFIMRSNGGVDTLKMAESLPISIMESGPASGVLGAAALGERIGERNIIALDVGGTTAKCSLIEEGRVRVVTQYVIEKTPQYAGYPLMIPGIDIVEIGQGGGSIAWVDAHGGLHVGPKSAGAMPGPAAYGRGGKDFTTTDANLLTGRIDPEYFLGGAIRADMEAVRAAAKRLGDALSLSIEDTARGVIRFANDNMVNALKLVSLNRGYDPRDFTLVAFGGGGGMHAASLAAELGIPKVIIPVNSAVFSALGMLMSDQRRDYVRTKVTRLDQDASGEVASIYAALQKQAREEFAAESIAPRETLQFDRFADMRYQGQEHSVKVPFPAGEVTAKALTEAIATFAAIHKREYTYTLENPVELVNYHLVATQKVAKPDFRKLAKTGRPLKDAVCGKRPVDFDVQGVHDSLIYERSRLEPGHEIKGPAIVREPDTSIVVPPSHFVTVDDYGNLHIAPKAS